MNLRVRSYQKELLDQDDIPLNDLIQNLKELEVVNTRLGGHSVTLDGFKELVGERRNISVCEVGSGGGDNLVAIEKWCDQHGVAVRLQGIDIKSECIEFARAKHLLGSATFMVSDYKKVSFPDKPDIIFSSLFCHHFTDEELIFQLKWMRENSRVGFFINDLHRHSLAYHSIKLLTSLFSRSYLVKNDAPLSVARGFTKQDWHRLLSAAGITNCSIVWKWAFRYLVVYRHEGSATDI
jgi:2-polyprenyl-3-methyl-5-hydroxy-6-metoxy-1,4-benzoquinol methylase